MWQIDHLAVVCTDLAEGVARVEAALGVPMSPGGVHPAMGTHNRLLSLGPDTYLEVIAIDPAAPVPARPRWFDLDRLAGPPRLANWVARGPDLAPALAAVPGAGRPLRLSRGDLSWEMAVPDDGILPFDGLFPALIRWHGTAHPAQRLPDLGLRLTMLDLHHPRADALGATLSPLLSDARLRLHVGPPALHATFSTPDGPRSLA